MDLLENRAAFLLKNHRRASRFTIFSLYQTLELTAKYRIISGTSQENPLRAFTYDSGIPDQFPVTAYPNLYIIANGKEANP